jgi:hypothetical protein
VEDAASATLLAGAVHRPIESHELVAISV